MAVVRLDDALWERLQAERTRTGVPIAEQLRRAVSAWLDPPPIDVQVDLEIKQPAAVPSNNEVRRQRLKAAREQGWHLPSEWRALCQEVGGRCVRCGDYPEKLTKDHIVPIYQGGDDGIGNIQPLCFSCNASKGPENTNHLAEFRRGGRPWQRGDE